MTTSADPEECGTVSGGGPCYYHQHVTLTATANDGYIFSNWTKDGTVVSNVSNYSFYVTESAEYVAHFEPISSSISIGSGVATNNYLPSHSSYDYALSQQIYTAEEIGMAGTIKSIAFYNGGAEETRVYDMYMVLTDKTVFDSNTDWITITEADKVFSGTAYMVSNAWTFFALDTPFEYDGASNLVLVMDDNSGSYTSSPHMACRVFNANGNQAIMAYSFSNYNPFNPAGYNGTRYTVKNQIILGITSSMVVQNIDLTVGWNWFSTYIEVDDPVTMLQMVEASLGENGIQIKSSLVNTEYDSEWGWFGDLDDVGMTNEQMYMIRVSAPCTLTVEGIPANPENHPITINKGWNWIGFPSGVAMSLEAAFDGFAQEGDKIKNSGAQIEYDPEWGWYGDFETLEPGQGYMYFSASNTPRTLIFPSGVK